ncbi:hypothetical protein HK096_001940 [Nowakowskiella sp. JEL0078]|nr:hypothetical protein HK096_001940 [Nowakowskiella sp. JEL0078]
MESDLPHASEVSSMGGECPFEIGFTISWKPEFYFSWIVFKLSARWILLSYGSATEPTQLHAACPFPTHVGFPVVPTQSNGFHGEFVNQGL